MPERAAVSALATIKKLFVLMMFLTTIGILLVVKTSADARAQNCRVIERTINGWQDDVVDLFATRERTPEQQAILDAHLVELKGRTHNRLAGCQ